MYQLESIIRRNILELEPYSCARHEYTGKEAIFIDANELPFNNSFNRYPDPEQTELKARLSEIKGVGVRNIVLGNGSDEIIDLIIRSACEPQEDNIIVFSPSYSMYEVSAHVNNVECRKLVLNEKFHIDYEALWKAVDSRTKLLFLCNPNNPTGNVMSLDEIGAIIEKFEGLVIVDEAYIDFTKTGSAVSLLDSYPNLIVMQTLSKAWGMAGLRLGMCFASEELAAIFNKVRAPYNIGSMVQREVLKTLDDMETYRRNIALLLSERERMYQALKASPLFEEVLPSEANFILVRTPEFREIYSYLVTNGVIARLRYVPPVLNDGIRISIGTIAENDRLLDLLHTYKKK